MESENISSVNAVINYVNKSSSSNRHPKTRQQIATLLSQQNPLSKGIILYRGINSEFPENLETWKPYLPTDFFSTSESIEVAESFIDYKSCCVLKIHVQPGVRVLDVKGFVQKHNRSFPLCFINEDEWIVQGGGFFFANREATIPGFAKLSKEGHYVTYYFPEFHSKSECIGHLCAVMGGGRSLFDAIHDGNVEECKQLIADGADINELRHYTVNKYMQWVTPLILCIINKRLNIAKLLLATPGIDVNRVDKFGSTPLLLSVNAGLNIEFIRELLSIPDININKKDDYGYSALHSAVINSQIEIVKELLKHPTIQVNLYDKGGLTALDLAISYENNDIITLLREAGGKPTIEIPAPHISHAVKWYANTDSTKNRHPNTRTMIMEALFQQKQLMEEKMVYRGMNLTKFNPYFPKDFFSVAESKKIALGFTGYNCCMITIYLQPGLYILNVPTFLVEHGFDSGHSTMEQEWLVEGGGEFFADKQKTTPGFAELKKSHYVTYYFPPASRVLESVPNANILKGGRKQQKQRTLRKKYRKNESRKYRRTYRR